MITAHIFEHDWGYWDEIIVLATAAVTGLVVWLLTRSHYERRRVPALRSSHDAESYEPPRSYWRFAKRVWLTLAALFLGNATAMLASGHRALGVVFIIASVPLVVALLRDGRAEDDLARAQYALAERVFRPVREWRAVVTVTPNGDAEFPEITVHVPPPKGEHGGSTE